MGKIINLEEYKSRKCLNLHKKSRNAAAIKKARRKNGDLSDINRISIIEIFGKKYDLMKIEIRGRRGIDLSGLTIKMTVKVKRFFRWVEETYVFEANNGKESSGDIGLGYYRLCLASKKPISRKARKMIVKRDQDKRIEVSFKGEKAIFTLNAA